MQHNTNNINNSVCLCRGIFENACHVNEIENEWKAQRNGMRCKTNAIKSNAVQYVRCPQINKQTNEAEHNQTPEKSNSHTN